MGALSPVLTGITAVTSAIGAVDRAFNAVGKIGRDSYEDQSRVLRAQQDLALRQLQEQQAAHMRDAQEQAALDRARTSAEAAASEDARRAALRRAVARQRAAFGAQGLDASGDDGSSEAVLLGLFQDSDSDRQTRERLDTIRTAAIDQGLENQRRINVLQKTQLQERQRLERIREDYA